MNRVGTGWDIHRLVEGRPLVLGGVVIQSSKGCLGHSDGDALLHATIDAMFGAAGLDDIGTYFPDKDPQYKDISSILLLKKAKEILLEKGCFIVNIDTTVILQSPKLGPYRSYIKNSIAQALEISPDCVGFKAKTAEGILGELGSSDAVVAQAVVLISKENK